MGAKRKVAVNRSTRAGVLFPVGRVHRYLKKKIIQKRISERASVYLSGVLEYLSAEVLELSGNAAREHKMKRISPRHLLLAVRNDEELNELLRHVTLPSAGVLPHIHRALIPTVVTKTAGGGATFGPAAIGTKQKKAPKKKKAVKKAARATPTKKTKAVKGKKLNVTGAGKGKSAKLTASRPANKGGRASGPTTILSEKTLQNGQKLTVIQGDVVNMKADAIIHPSDSHYGMNGEVGRALRAAGGKKLEDILRNASSSPIPPAGAMITESSNIAAKHIIHVNSPSWNSANSQQNLDSCVTNVFKVADKQKLTSVAIPSISSGNAGFPKQTAAQIILAAIRKYFSSTKNSSIRQVYFVLYDKESVNVYVTELGKIDP